MRRAAYSVQGVHRTLHADPARCTLLLMPLIVLEGPEGAGKTTQVERLARGLAASGKPVIALREPGATPLGEVLRSAVLHADLEITPAAESLVFMAARAQLVAYEIKPALEAGKVVILDRFFLSTYAYQVAGRGLDEGRVVDANMLATTASTSVGISKQLIPDLTLLLSLPAEEGLSRAKQRSAHDRIERADAGFHQRVARGFAEFATAAWQKKHPEAGPIVVIDASGSVNDVEQRVFAAVRAKMPKLT